MSVVVLETIYLVDALPLYCFLYCSDMRGMIRYSCTVHVCGNLWYLWLSLQFNSHKLIFSKDCTKENSLFVKWKSFFL